MPHATHLRVREGGSVDEVHPGKKGSSMACGVSIAQLFQEAVGVDHLVQQCLQGMGQNAEWGSYSSCAVLVWVTLC